jgi:HSP20 family molecular chaperone IbpA
MTEILLNDPFFRQATNDPFFSLGERPFFDNLTLPQQQRLGTYFRFPRLDMTETDNDYVIKADLPGLKKENVHVHVQDGVLTIEGERKEERVEEGETRHFVERSFGRFSRSLRLPQDASIENLQALMNQGVLELKIQKNPSEKGRKNIMIA